jgi:agmatinase
MTLSKGEPQLRIAGIMSFMRAPQGDVEDLKEGMIAIAGVTYDLSCTSRIGSRFAPRAIRDTSAYYGGYLDRGEIVEITTGQRMKAPEDVKVIDLGDLNVYPVNWDQTAGALRDSMRQIAGTGALPVILGGDHFITYPLVEGFKDAVVERRGSKVGYIQFSSQLDLGDEDPVWGKVWRGATARRIIDGGTVDTKNMVWVGANGYIRAEQLELAQELNLNVFTLADIRNQGITAVAQQAAEIAGDGCDAVYLSVDFDVLDGGYVAMTGAPSFDGITNVELLKAVDVLRRTKVGAMDLVGMNPTVEMSGATGQRFAVWLVVRFMSEKVLAWA